MATLTLLASEGVATLQRTPSRGNKQGKLEMWIEDSVSWMQSAGWLEEGEAESVSTAARKTADEHEIKGKPEIRVLNLGEGWRSIAKAVLKKYPTARVVGLSGQETLYVDGLRERVHHGGGAPRLVAEELSGGQRPDLGSLQKSVSPGDGVGRDRLGAGVHPLRQSE